MQKGGYLYVRVVRLCQSLWIIKWGRALYHVPKRYCAGQYFHGFLIIRHSVSDVKKPYQTVGLLSKLDSTDKNSFTSLLRNWLLNFTSR